MASPEELQPISRPVKIDSLDVVRNTYSLEQHQGSADPNSKPVMEEYLADRHVPPPGPRFNIVFTETGKTLPSIGRVPNGQKTVTRYPKAEGHWLVSPRTAAIVALSTLALSNLVENAKGIDGATRYAAHSIYRIFKPVHGHDEKINTIRVVPGKTQDISVEAGLRSKVGSTELNTSAIRGLVEKIHDSEKNGGKLKSLTVTGETSDEWDNDSSISKPDSGNQQLGLERARKGVFAIKNTNLDISGIKLNVTSHENVLSMGSKRAIRAHAKADGHPDIKSAISAQDSGQQLKPALAARIKKFFTGKNNRGVKLTAHMEIPGKQEAINKTTTKHIAGKDNVPEHPPLSFVPWFLPLPFMRRRQKTRELKDRKKFAFIPRRPILKPEIIREDEEHAWVRLRPEALNEDKTLRPNPWAYTRKFEHLLRDDRIAEVVRADYKNAEDEDKSLHLVFVDHKPEEATLKAFTNVMNSMANMQDGRLADVISGMFIYSRASAGFHPHNPRHISVGVDKQSKSTVYGEATPILELVELHMPTNASQETLETILKEYLGPTWVLAHEAVGHGTDIKKGLKRLLRPVRSLSIANAHLPVEDPWVEEMQPLQDELKNLPGPTSQEVTEVEYDITYKVLDQNGSTVSVTSRVKHDDPRLTHADKVTIGDHKPTHYANTDVLEHYAETASAVTTGIEIPLERLAVKGLGQHKTDDGEAANFATSYQPDVRGQKRFTDAVEAEEGSYPVTFVDPTPVSFTRIAPETDPLFNREMARARSLETLKPEQMIAILSRVISSRKK